jgi:hypothetical protein
VVLNDGEVPGPIPVHHLDDGVPGPIPARYLNVDHLPKHYLVLVYDAETRALSPVPGCLYLEALVLSGRLIYSSEVLLWPAQYHLEVLLYLS